MEYRILDGNELIIQGGLEAGVSLYTGYPGSPLADFFNVLQARRAELTRHGVRVAIANNEGNAAAMAAGARQAGRDCLLAMKSMGLQVAADALSVGNFADPGPRAIDPDSGTPCHAGVVVVVGDDPWCQSTATPADSRYLFKHLHIPFLEPATPQELKDGIALALTLSRRSSLYVGVVVPTFLAEGGGRVCIRPWTPLPRETARFDPDTLDLTRNVMVPPNSRVADREMIRVRFPRALEVLTQLSLDHCEGDETAELGFIAAGPVYPRMRQVLDELGLGEEVALYRPAGSWPLVESALVPWLVRRRTVVVVEEKRGFLEQEVAALCQAHGLEVRVMGKRFRFSDEEEEGFPADGGLSHELMRERIEVLLQHLRPATRPLSPAEPIVLPEALPPRLPTFCPGCPHRETLSILKAVRRSLARVGIPLVTHGDVGCYSLSFLPPFGEMHDIGAMGQGGAVGAGTDLFTGTPSVVLMGDSTFFHTGVTAISNSVQLGHDVTYIVLDNGVTAMTGHQVDPRSGESVEGLRRPQQDILGMVRAMGVTEAIEVNPSDRYFYLNLLADYVRRPGTKVIVSRKECGLTYHARLRAREREMLVQGKPLPEKVFYRINTSACEDCRACIEATGCPGLSRTEDAYGPKVSIDPQICVADGYCSKILACPSFEKIRVIDYLPPTTRHDDVIVSEELPEPAPRKTLEDISAGNIWRVVVTGVGGSGVTTITRVLAEAALALPETLEFSFIDQKGLAQRNGQVTSHLALYRAGAANDPVTPQGGADLLLAADLLDGAHSLAWLAPHGLALCEEDMQLPLSLMLDEGEREPPLTPQRLHESLRRALGERLYLLPARRTVGQTLGRSVYAPALLLGAAWQAGAIPFPLEAMRTAFERALPSREFATNWQAFLLGRRLFITGPEPMSADEPEAELTLLRTSLVESLPPWTSAEALLTRFEDALQRLTRLFPEVPLTHIARYLHDLLLYDRGATLEDYLTEATRVVQRYAPEHRALALRVLTKTHFVKDEIFIAHVLVSPLEAAKRQHTYGRLGHSLRVSHPNRPRLELFGRHLEITLESRPWMLRLLRHCRFLRRLPGWHQREREIAEHVRTLLLEEVPCETDVGFALRRLDGIKGYRETRYEKAERKLAAFGRRAAPRSQAENPAAVRRDLAAH
ncbi:MAG: 2-oxoacid:acceptor oxidoreductase family protein [Rhodocyclales bacterium]|nr:2-oxoacid:acceptor oxidoreductase family protein [Rhodocyclales bacterium]